MKGKLVEYLECLLYLGILEFRVWGKSLCVVIFFLESVILGSKSEVKGSEVEKDGEVCVRVYF